MGAMTGASNVFALFYKFSSVGAAATVARYRLDAPRGVLFLLGAMFDPFVYALAVYFVLTTVFQFEELERLHILLIGFIAFRWGIAALVGANNFVGILRRMSEVSAYPFCAAITAVMAPPTFVFLISLACAYAFSLALDMPQQSFDAVGWLPFVIFVQGVWMVVLVLALAAVRGKRMGASDAPIVAAASLLWFLSPVMYTFRDIPEGASKLLTSYNPISHLLAAYQNAYWYGQSISLEILPIAALAGIALIVVLRRFVGDGNGVDERLTFEPSRRPGIQLIYYSGATRPSRPGFASGDGVGWFTPWRERFKDLKGRDLARLIVANWTDSRAERDARVDAVRRTSDTGRLFDDYIAIYPDRALDQLAFAVAVESAESAIVLDGILDTLSMEFVAAVWASIERECAKGRSITVICYRPLLPPVSVQGAFEIVAAGAAAASGEIGTALIEAYNRIGADLSREEDGL